MNPAPYLIKASGMSLPEIAFWQGVGLSTVKNWSTCRTPMPEATVEQLKMLVRRQCQTTDHFPTPSARSVAIGIAIAHGRAISG